MTRRRRPAMAHIGEPLADIIDKAAERAPAKRDEMAVFADWLAARGAEVLTTTNEWEMVRFRSDRGVGVIYQNRAGKRSYTGPAHDAWQGFRSNTDWRAFPRGSRRTRHRTDVVLQTLFDRDGEACFFCGDPLEEDVTKEHLHSVTNGGNSHLGNLALAHEGCNLLATHLSVVEKVKLREQLHASASRRQEKVA